MKSGPGRTPDFLQHILEAIARISTYTAGMNEADFAANQMVQDAVIRNIENMGEAARNIEASDPDFISKHPQVPLRDVYLMRNRLAHGYFTVDIVLGWNAVKTDIPALREQILAIKS